MQVEACQRPTDSCTEQRGQRRVDKQEGAESCKEVGIVTSELAVSDAVVKPSSTPDDLLVPSLHPVSSQALSPSRRI